MSRIVVSFIIHARYKCGLTPSHIGPYGNTATQPRGQKNGKRNRIRGKISGIRAEKTDFRRGPPPGGAGDGTTGRNGFPNREGCRKNSQAPAFRREKRAVHNLEKKLSLRPSERKWDTPAKNGTPCPRHGTLPPHLSGRPEKRKEPSGSFPHQKLTLKNDPLFGRPPRGSGAGRTNPHPP